MAEQYVKFLRGSLANYQALATKDSDTLYFVYNEDDTATALYLGSRLIAGSGTIEGANNLDELNDVLIKTVANRDILMYDSGLSQWKNISFENLLKEISNNLNVASSTQVFEVELNITIGENDVKVKETHSEALIRIVGESNLNKGDIAIIKDPIGSEKFQYTSYVYNGTNWTAMDGNYNANNVYFDEDFIFTKNIGTVVIPATGNTIVPAAGKSVKEFFAGLFATEQESSISKPSISSFSLNKAGSYEVGTVLNNLTYTATFEDGNYTYGPEPTGVSVSSWTITDNIGNNIGSSASGTLTDYTVSKEEPYYLQATASYTAGSYAKTNLGNTSTTTHIIAGATTLKKSDEIKGYWQTFYGVLDIAVKDNIAENITSDFIRENLTHGGAYTAGPINLQAYEGAKCLIIACPVSKPGVSKAIMPSSLQLPIPWINGSPFTISIEGATNAVSTDYNIWIYEPASIDASETYEITLG